MACERCAAFCETVEITLPEDLRAVFRRAQAGLAAGVLAEVAGDPPLAALDAEGPFDDIVHYALSCTACGEGFALSCETYHGRGGAWRRTGR